MSDYELLDRVDKYIQNLFSANDAALQQALDNSLKHGLPAINVSANEGKLLYLLARLCGAKKVLEIGTLGAYSTIWLARALPPPPDGRVLTLEYEPKHAEVARANIAQAGLADRIEVRVGAALDLLPGIEAGGEGPFDLFFIDADKVNYPHYLQWCIRLSRPGSLILSDNLLRDGKVLDPPPDDAAAQATAHFNQMLATDPRLESLILPIMRGHVDGLGISLVRAYAVGG